MKMKMKLRTTNIIFRKLKMVNTGSSDITGGIFQKNKDGTKCWKSISFRW